MALVSEAAPEGTQQEARTLSKQSFLDAYVAYELGGDDGLPRFVDTLMKLCHNADKKNPYELIRDTMISLDLPPYRVTHLMGELRKIVGASDQERFTKEQIAFAKEVLISYDQSSPEEGQMMVVAVNEEGEEPSSVVSRWVAAYFDDENVNDKEIAGALFPKLESMPADGQIEASLVEQSAIAALQRLKSLGVIGMDDEKYKELEKKYTAGNKAEKYSRDVAMQIAVEIVQMIRRHREIVNKAAAEASTN